MIARRRRALEQSLHVRYAQRTMASSSLGPDWGARNSPIPVHCRPAMGSATREVENHSRQSASLGTGRPGPVEVSMTAGKRATN